MIERMFTAFFIFAFILAFTACAGLQLQRMPEEGSADLALIQEKCTICHGLPHPKRHTVGEWDHMLKLMVDRMKEKDVSYTSDEMRKIQAYLHRNAR